jgi:C1A family cysteine protease
MARARRLALTLIAAAIVAAGGATVSAASALAAPTLRFAAPNPAFCAWLKDRDLRTFIPTNVSGRSLKPLVPVPVNPVSWTMAQLRHGPLVQGDSTLPTSYDPRDSTLDPNFSNLLPPIRDQGTDNDCWAFSSIASLEWSLLPLTTQLDQYDYDEYDLAYKAGNDFDWGLQDGGNYQIATAELARWNAPVSAAAGADGSYTAGLPTIEHVQNVLFLPDRTSSTDNDTIKAAVLQYGAVYTAMYADQGMASDASSAYYDPSTSAYYYNGTGQADHAVDIVGWDDNYPASNFSTDPGIDGAFICRNSWGTGFGDSGYFYVSYADTVIGTSMAVFTGEPTTDYAQNLGYDKLGLTDTTGFTTATGAWSDTGWMAAAFTVKGDSTLEAAGFYALSPGTSYAVYLGSNLYDGATWTAVGSGSFDEAGYHTVTFDTPQQAIAGVRFYVIVQLTSPGVTTGGPIPIEDRQTGYSSKATAATGQTFVSPDGTIDWSDLAVVSGGAEATACLKVFAGPPTPDPYRPLTKALAAATVVRGRSVNLRYRVNDATPHDIEKVVIRIRTRTGKPVKTIAVGAKAPNVSLSYHYRCMLARGAYRFYVYATDRWGNTQTRVGQASLTVR